MEGYQQEEMLGVGSYGKVYNARYRSRILAVKIFHTYIFNAKDPGSRELIAQLQELKFLIHNSLVKYYDIYCNDEQLFVYMERCDKSLTSFLEEHSQEPLPYQLQLKITMDIALALEYLHGQSLLHGNLSSNNVLMDSKNNVKVSDYGYVMFRTRARAFSNEHCFPPEITRQPARFTKMADIFSAGVLLVQILTRVTIGINLSECGQRQKYIDMIDNEHPLKKVCLQCLKDEQEIRPTAENLVERLTDLKGVVPKLSQPEKPVVPYRSPTNMQSSSNDTEIRLMLLGEQGVGKSNIIKVYNGEDFSTRYPPTLQPDMCKKTVIFKGKAVNVIIWDTVGQENFMNITKNAFRKIKGVLLVYDITRKESFQKLPTWINLAKRYSDDDRLEIVVVGNKMDDEGHRQVSETQGQTFAQEHGVPFFEISAYRNRNIEEAFFKLIGNIMTHNPLTDDICSNIQLHESDTVHLTDAAVQKKTCCKR